MLGGGTGSVFTELEASWASFDAETVKGGRVALKVGASYGFFTWALIEETFALVSVVDAGVIWAANWCF